MRGPADEKPLPRAPRSARVPPPRGPGLPERRATRETRAVRRSSEDVVEHDASVLAVPWPESWSPEAVIRRLEPFVSERRRERMLTTFGARLGCVTVVMDAPHDPHNGAAVLRSCDAFGVQRMHVIQRDEPFAISRTVAQGTERWVDALVYDSVDPALERLRQGGFQLVTTHPEGGLVPEDLAQIPRLALVFGNERDGIREALTRAASASVRIPMRGFVESLNVSVSAAILLHAATRGRTGDLAESERTLLYARALFRSVHRAADILAASSPV